MRPAVVYREFETTFEGEVIPMSMDENSLVHLMNQYIDLYKDSKRAILREYSTNAFDSHLAAGHTFPIEITLPSRLAPVLIIADRGTGMDLDDIRDTFSKYGASTKRESDDYNGILGLGCKSGLAYADQFTMECVKDGIRTIVSISRDARGAGSITVVEKDRETVQPNGVTITIPTKREDTFEEEAADLFQYWPEGSVLVNGQRPQRFTERLTNLVKIDEDLYLRRADKGEVARSVVVMGNVAYPVDYHLWGIDDLSSDHEVIAFVPIGTVEFAPTRESLRLEPPTREALREIGTFLRERAAGSIQQDIDAAPSLIEALRRVIAWQNTLPKSFHPKQWTYGGYDVPAKFSLPGIVTLDNEGNERRSRPRFQVVPGRPHTLNQHNIKNEVPAGVLADAVIFYGYNVKWTANHRRKLDLWQEHSDLSKPETYIMLDDPPPAEWLEWISSYRRVFSYEEVRAMKLPKPDGYGGGGNGRLTGSYDAFTPGNMYHWEVLAANIDTGKPIYYYVGTQEGYKRGRYSYVETREDKAKPYMKLMRIFDGDCTVVLLPETRVNKFLQQFPGAREILAATEERFNRWKGQLSEDAKRALMSQDADALDLFQALKHAPLADPWMAQGARVAKKNWSSLYDRREAFRQAGKPFQPDSDESPFKRYPLLEDVRYTDERILKHVITYLNAAYAALVQETK